MPRLDAPEWLLLLPAIAFMAWYWRRPRLERPLRTLALIITVAVLTRPYLPGKGDGLDLWVLADHSASSRDLLVPRLGEIETLLGRSRSGDDRLFFVDFAETVRKRGDNEAEPLAALGEETRLATAIQFALGSMDSSRNGRLLVLSDGFSTEPLESIHERLRRQNVSLDLRVLVRDEERDVAVEGIDLPFRVQPGEPFPILVRFRGEPDGPVPFTLLRNGEPLATATADIADGRDLVRFSDRLSGGGAVRYEARLDVPDGVPGNDRGMAWIEVDAGPRVLLLTAYADDPVAAVLRQQGFQLDVVTEPSRLSLGNLTGVRAVIFNNVPASELPSEIMKALPAYVRVQGGGLLMAGGRYSFGSGGYFESPVDALLPVSMELREDHRTLAVAMAIVMDRSGSMGMGVAGGRTKMELANEGAARSIELLGPNDAVAVFAVDSAAHTIVPLTPLSEGASAIVDKVRRIDSRGGGIFVYQGLKAAWGELRRARQGQRHVILFSDAADSEEPGDYVNLVAEMVDQGATVSVIGLGTPSDPDAALLQDIALRGKGRIFFNADPQTLPALFAQETVAVARSTFVEDPAGVEATAGWLEVSSAPLSGLTAVDGYNLSYLREDATAAAFTTDEYEAPLVAFWNRGAGRVAAVSFPLGGEDSHRVRTWSSYGDFLQTLSRWLMGEEIPPGIGLTTRLNETRLELDLWFDETWEPRFATSSPEIFLVAGSADEVETLVWERLEPGRFRASKKLASGEVYRGAVHVGRFTLPLGPIVAPLGAEWDFAPERLEALRELSRLSGGVDRTELTTVWDERIVGSNLDLRPILLWALLGILLLEALLSRLGWQLPDIRWVPRASPARVGSAPKVRPAIAEVVTDTEGAERPEPVLEQRRRRFDRAKRGR